MRSIIDSTQSMCNGVCNTQANIGECHAGNKLAKCHALTAVRFIGNCTPEALADQTDSFQIQAVRQSPCTLGGIAFDGVCQGIHTGGSSQALGHSGHHFGINDGNVRNIIDIDADELTLPLHIGNNIVDGSFRSGTGGSRNGDGVDSTVLGRSNAFQRTDVSKLRVINNDTDGLTGIHGRTTAHGDHIVCSGSLVSGNTGLNILNSGIRLNIGIKLICHAGSIQNIRNLLGNTELQQIRIGCNKCFLVTLSSNQAGDFLDGTFTVVRNCVGYKTIGHDSNLQNNNSPAFKPLLSIL